MPLSERISVDDLRLFFLLHEAGGITAAARRFGVPKATLSRALSRLEEIAGVPLFDRVSNGLKLTQAGEDLLEPAIAVTRAGSHAEEVMRSAKGEPSGALRIAASAISAQQLVGPVLARMHERYPLVRPSVRVTGRGPDPLAEDLDVVLRLDRPAEPYLIARKIVTAPLRLYVSANLSEVIDLANPGAVEGLGRILVDAPGSPQTWLMTNAEGHRIEMRAPPFCTIGDPSVALGILGAGKGVALLPTAYGEPYVGAKTLQRALPDYEGPKVEIFASLPPRRVSVPAVRAFLDLLVEFGQDIPH